MTSWLRRLTAVALTLLCVWAMQARGLANDCAARFTSRIGTALMDPAMGDVARDWFNRYRGATDVGQRGMQKAVLAKDLKILLETFNSLDPHQLPFASREEVYEAIGRLTGSDFVGVEGLDGLLGNLFAFGQSNQLGATFTLKVADDINLGARAGPGQGFEKVRSVGGGETRRYDIFDADGRYHENKHWSSGITGASDSRVLEFVDEFRRDVLFFRGEVGTYRINLRLPQANQAQQLDIVRDSLAEVYDRPEIADLLGGALESARLKGLFLAAWNAGSGGPLLKIYTS